MFPGYASRLFNEMKALYKKKTSKIEPKPTNSDNGPETSKIEPKPTESVGGEKTSESKSTENNNGKKTKKNKVITIIDSARRKYSVFIGATVLAKTYNNVKGGENSGYWITKQDWEEVGPNIVLKKCQNIMA
jgi:actin-related protein